MLENRTTKIQPQHVSSILLVSRLARFINRDIVVVGDKLEETEAVNIFGASTDWTGSQSREPGRPGRRCCEVARGLDNDPESTPGSSCWCFLVSRNIHLVTWQGVLLMTQFIKFLFEKGP